MTRFVSELKIVLPLHCSVLPPPSASCLASLLFSLEISQTSPEVNLVHSKISACQGVLQLLHSFAAPRLSLSLVFCVFIWPLQLHSYLRYYPDGHLIASGLSIRGTSKRKKCSTFIKTWPDHFIRNSEVSLKSCQLHSRSRCFFIYVFPSRYFLLHFNQLVWQ